ncbi:hypothetical protein MTO96_029013 [Rhipicephalus appendiculatus]
MSVGATFPETRHHHPASRCSSLGDQLPATSVTTSSRNIKARPSSDTAGASEIGERQVSSASDVVVSEKPEPKSLTESDEVLQEVREVLLLYLQRPLPQALVILEGAPLGPGGQDFERRIKTCTPSTTTTATTITKTNAAAHLSSWTESPPGRVRLAFNGIGCWPRLVSYGRRAGALHESLVVEEEVEHVNTSERGTPGASYHQFLLGTGCSSRHRAPYVLQGCDAARQFSPELQWTQE